VVRGDLTLIFFQFKPLKDLIKEVKFLMSSDKRIKIVKVNSLESLVELVNEEANSVIFSCVSDKSDLTLVLSAMKATVDHIKNKRIRFVSINLTGENSVKQVLIKRGCKDVLTEKQATPRKIKFKINFCRKMLYAPVLGEDDGFDDRIDSLVKESGKGGAAAQKPKPSGGKKKLKILDPLKIPQDFWVLDNTRSVSFTKDSGWVLKMKGPSPNHAFWAPVEDESKRGNTWKLTFEDAAPKELKDKGGLWQFDGDRPYYSTQEQVWVFSGLNFKLYLVEYESIAHVRSHVEDTTMYLTKNSPSELQKVVEANQLDKKAAGDQKFIYKQGEEAKTVVKGTEEVIPATEKHTIGDSEQPELTEEYIEEITQDASTQAFIHILDKNNNPTDNVAHMCELDDVFDSEAAVVVPKSLKFNEKNIKVDLRIVTGKDETKVEFAGKIEVREEYDDEHDLLVIHSDNIDAAAIDKFYESFEKRQENIESFLKLATG
jgi:hypothetical protein